jgi:lipooligosaccharide transport system ATP-binding protein
MTRELVIQLRGVVKRYGPITAVDHLDLDVPGGTCAGLLGPDGVSRNSSSPYFPLKND